MSFKYFLAYENDRNTHHGDLFVAIIKRAMGSKEVALVGHHFVCDYDNDLKTLNEIPSADTLIFDHPIMTAVFGDDAKNVMASLAVLPCEERDDYLRKVFTARFPNDLKQPDPAWWAVPPAHLIPA